MIMPNSTISIPETPSRQDTQIPLPIQPQKAWQHVYSQHKLTESPEFDSFIGNFYFLFWGHVVDACVVVGMSPVGILCRIKTNQTPMRPLARYANMCSLTNHPVFEIPIIPGFCY